MVKYTITGNNDIRKKVITGVESQKDLLKNWLRLVTLYPKLNTTDIKWKEEFLNNFSKLSPDYYAG